MPDESTSRKPTRRNDACPCGSGLKYKKCHGAGPLGLLDGHTAELYIARPIVRASPSGADPRPCGECAKCCAGWVRTRVLGHDIDLHSPCPHSSGHHCTIHASRPADPCRIFFCGWAEAGSELPDWMQPSRCGVIVLAGRSSWAGRAVDVLVSAGNDPDPQFLAWYQAYSIRALRPFLYQQRGRWYGFGPPAFQHEIARRAARGERLFL